MTDFQNRVKQNCKVDKTSNPIKCTARTPYTDADLQVYAATPDPVAMLCIIAAQVCSAEVKYGVKVSSKAQGRDIVCWSGVRTSLTATAATG